MIKLVEKEHCSGCTACMACCPKEAISMCADEEGFKYPVIDRNQCVECEKCVRTCPVTNKQKKNPVVASYIAINNDKKQRESSASGGLFSVIAHYVLEKKGIVFGAAYDEKLRVKHIAIEHEADGFKDDDMGLSNVYVRTQKAIDLWKQIETQVTAVKTETAVTNKNDGDMIYESAVKNKARAEFWSDYGKLSYTELIDKYIPYSKKEAIMDKVKRVMVSTGLSKNLKIKKLLTKIKK